MASIILAVRLLYGLGMRHGTSKSRGALCRDYSIVPHSDRGYLASALRLPWLIRCGHAINREWKIVNLHRFSLSFVLALVALTGQGQSVWAGIAENTLYIAVQAGHLTVRATDAPLAKVLRELAERTDIRVYGVYDEPRLATKKITVEFHDLTIEKGVGKILAGYNSVLMFSGKTIRDSSSCHRLTDVWVLIRGEESYRQKGQENGFDIAHLPREGIKSPDPSIRRETVESLGERQDAAVIPDLLNLLNDSDQGVRLAALDTLGDLIDLDTVWVDRLAEMVMSNEDPQIRMAAISSGLPLPYETLVDHALHDQDPQVRIEALQALEDEKENKKVATQALKDPDSSVRTAAQEILNPPKENPAP